MRRAAIVVVAIAAAGAPASIALAAGAKGDVTFELRVRHSKQVYIEGSVQALRVISEKTGKVVIARRLTNHALHRRLAAGDYRVRSWTRICDGTCQNLDPPSFRCSGRFTASSLNFVTVRVATKVGAPCRIEVLSTMVGEG